MKIKTADDYWEWAEKTLLSELKVIWVPSIYLVNMYKSHKAGPLYNGQPPYGYRGYIGDLVQRMMGYATLRQVRYGL